MKIRVLFSRFFKKMRVLLVLIKTGNVVAIINGIRVRICSNTNSIGLTKDLNKEFEYSNPKIDVDIRLFEEQDVNALNENYRHIGFINQHIPDCYTAVTKDNKPCFRIWFMNSEQNERIENYFGNIFPELKKDEILIEGVFTNPEYRGLKIMPYVIGELSEKNKKEGINKIIAFVDLKNTASLKGFDQSGFSPYILRKVRWCFFRRQVTFASLTSEILSVYNSEIVSQVITTIL